MKLKNLIFLTPNDEIYPIIFPIGNPYDSSTRTDVCLLFALSENHKLTKKIQKSQGIFLSTKTKAKANMLSYQIVTSSHRIKFI